MPRPIRATISVAALAHNLAVARAHAGDTTKLWAVVKANAYGHGIERAARAFAAADGFAVLDLQEAERLRGAGVRKPILLLEGFFEAADLASLERHALTPVVHSAEQLEMLQSGRRERALDAYLKANTGMNRLGFSARDYPRAYGTLRSLAGIGAVTLMTHFADADGVSGVREQLERFEAMARGLHGPRSFANSAALIRYPEARGDWARPGIMIYGCSPFADQTAEELGLRPAMTLASEIIATQRVRRGERVGYGYTYEAGQDLVIGIVACGYADGYPRHAPTGTPVLVNGRRTHLVGRVSMDMIGVDLSSIPEAAVGSPVTLWGEGLPADEVAAAAGTLSYELLCALAPRVPVVELN